jgi:hypothetical protein
MHKEYSVRHDCRSEFYGRLRSYRRYHRFFSIFGNCALVGVIVSMASSPPNEILFFCFLGLWGSTCIAASIKSRLACPSCSKDVRDSGEFCHSCGELGFPLRHEPRFFGLLMRECVYCHVSVYRPRAFPCPRVRFCRNCGSYLDDKGF